MKHTEIAEQQLTEIRKLLYERVRNQTDVEAICMHNFASALSNVIKELDSVGRKLDGIEKLLKQK